jgi:A/G-specific adenine glycosylase
MRRKHSQDSANSRDRAVVEVLSRWFRHAARDLPWRHAADGAGEHRNPYGSLVSEFMLQQTQVSRVLEKFEPFLQRFPTVGALAAASEHDVLAAWSGLGYYRRARLLHACSKAIVRGFGGKVPRDVESLQLLPGIGRYTAGAIASIVFNKPEPIVDGNVCRVLQRLDAKPGSASDKAVAAWAWERAQVLVQHCSYSRSNREGAGGGRRDVRNTGGASIATSTAGLKSQLQANPPPTPSLGEGASRHRAQDAAAATPAAFNEGLMELGALVCTPAAPKCLVCPLRDLCLAREQGLVEEIPAPKARARRSRVYHDTVVVWRKSGRGVEVLLEQRPATGLWAGMWQPPTAESATRRRRTLQSLLKELGLPASAAKSKPREWNFQTTHREVCFRVWTLQLAQEGRPPRRWCDEAEIAGVGFSNAHKEVISIALERELRAAGFSPRGLRSKSGSGRR